MSSWEKPQRSSPASIGRSSVRADRRGETHSRAGRPAQVHRRANVQVAGGFQFRLLRVAAPAAIGDRGAPGEIETADRGDFRAVGRDVRLPADPRRAAAVRPRLLAGAGPCPGARAGPGALPAAAVAAQPDRPGPGGRADPGSGATGTSPRPRRARRWSATSRTFRRGRAGYSSPP